MLMQKRIISINTLCFFLVLSLVGCGNIQPLRTTSKTPPPMSTNSTTSEPSNLPSSETPISSTDIPIETTSPFISVDSLSSGLYIAVGNSNRELILRNLDGVFVGIFESVYGSAPRISPDHKTIAFQSSDFPFSFLDLESNTIELFSFYKLHGYRSSWAPDGGRLVIETINDFTEVNQNLSIIDLQTGQHWRITSWSEGAIHPAWSPDGKWIAFVSNHLNYFSTAVFLLDTECIDKPETCEDKIIDLYIDDSVGVGFPSWSPDSSTLIFSCSIEETGYNLDVCMIDINTGLANIILETPESSEEHPSWSPDGEWIAYEIYSIRGNNIYIIHIDGSGKRLISSNDETFAFWLLIP